MSGPVLAIRGLTKRFMPGNAGEVRALDGLDLVLRDGDFISIIGSNGAGKSTLLKAVCGLVEPDSGTIALDGADITRWPAHRRAALIGRIAQDPFEGTCAPMTIAENLAMAALRGRRRGLRLAVTRERAAHFRGRVAELGLGLETRLDARVGTLSGGQRQALALTMATDPPPRLLLLDEHLANLDPRTAGLVMACTARIVAATGIATLMVTHNMEEAIRWGNRLIMLHAGRVIFAAEGAEKSALTVAALVAKFHDASGRGMVEDRALLTG